MALKGLNVQIFRRTGLQTSYKSFVCRVPAYSPVGTTPAIKQVGMQDDSIDVHVGVAFTPPVNRVRTQRLVASRAAYDWHTTPSNTSANI